MSKSYVTLIQRICVDCGEPYDTNELALDQRLREVFEHHTVVGFGLCDKCLETAKKNNGIWMFSTSTVQDITTLENAICVKEDVLRKLMSDLPETPRHICQFDPDFLKSFMEKMGIPNE